MKIVRNYHVMKDWVVFYSFVFWVKSTKRMDFELQHKVSCFLKIICLLQEM